MVLAAAIKGRMERLRKPWLAGGLLLIATVLWLACDGSGDGGNGGPGPLAGSCEPIRDFKRYRYVYTYSLNSPQPPNPPPAIIEERDAQGIPFAISPGADDFEFAQVHAGSFVAPDRFYIEVDTPSEESAGKLLLMYLGEQALSNPGTGWVESGVPNAYPPQHVCQAVLTGLDFSGLPSSPETINDIDTQRYATEFTVEQAHLSPAARLFGAESDMGRLLTKYEIEAWLAEDDGWPARMVAKSTANYPSGRQLSMEVSLEIKDINSRDIKIEPPEG